MKPLFAALLLGTSICSAWIPFATEQTRPFSPWPLPIQAAADGNNDVSFAACLYTDPTGYRWKAPKGTVTDGASIPTACLSFIGDRRDARWRGAALLHDAYCGQANTTGDSYRKATWQRVNRMFYDACLAGGTPRMKASLMYSAVWLFNRRWTYVDQRSPEYLAALAQAGGTALAEGQKSAANLQATLRANMVVMNAQRAEIQRLNLDQVVESLKMQQFQELSSYAKIDSLSLPKLDSILLVATPQLKKGLVLVLPGQ